MYNAFQMSVVILNPRESQKPIKTKLFLWGPMVPPKTFLEGALTFWPPKMTSILVSLVRIQTYRKRKVLWAYTLGTHTILGWIHPQDAKRYCWIIAGGSRELFFVRGHKMSKLWRVTPCQAKNKVTERRSLVIPYYSTSCSLGSILMSILKKNQVQNIASR